MVASGWRALAQRNPGLHQVARAMAASLQAITVAGPSLTLGSDVLIFEHLLFDHTSRLQPPQTAEASNIRDEEITLGRLAVIRQHALGSLVNLKSPPADVIVRELTALRAGRPPFTGCTVIDASCHGSGRDLAGIESTLGSEWRQRRCERRHLCRCGIGLC